MKAPKFIAAMAIAAVLSSGVAPAYADFNPDTGNANNGNATMQKTEKKDTTTPPTQTMSKPLEAQGDIKVEGEFTKTINSFPTPSQDGRYLRVTMPIKMDYTYNVDNHQMKAAQGTITNNSVHVETQSGSPGTQIVLDQPIKMHLVDVAQSGVGSTNTFDSEFVDTIKGVNTNNPNKVHLPFKLSITTGSSKPIEYNLKAIETASQNNNKLQPIDIQAGSNVQLEIGLINGEKIGNEKLITQGQSVTNHSLKLKFEYAGQ